MRTIQRDIVGAFIFSSDNKLLLGKAGVYQNHWVVPGGGVDEGETKLEAVKRETIEETGIDITDAVIHKIDGVHSEQSEKILRDTGERVFVKMTFYNFKVSLSQPADQISVNPEDDFTDAQWFSISKLKSMKLSPPTIVTLQKLGYL